MQRTFRLLLLLAVVAATKATLVDRVVPEDQMPDVEDAIPTTTLLSVPEMQGELATLATHTHTGGQKTAIRQLTDTMALLEIPKDGGTQALMDRVEAMMDVVKPAIGTMKAGLDSDFTTAQGDLSTLLGAINSTHRAVLDTEKADIGRCPEMVHCLGGQGSRCRPVHQCHHQPHGVQSNYIDYGCTLQEHRFDHRLPSRHSSSRWQVPCRSREPR